MTILSKNFEPIPMRQLPDGLSYGYQESVTGLWPVVINRQGDNVYILPNDGKKRVMIKVSL